MSALTQQVLGYCGLASATLLFLAPVPTCRRVLAARSAEGFDVTPYATSLAQCALWVVYALPAVTPDRCVRPLFPLGSLSHGAGLVPRGEGEGNRTQDHLDPKERRYTLK